MIVAKQFIAWYPREKGKPSRREAKRRMGETAIGRIGAERLCPGGTE